MAIRMGSKTMVIYGDSHAGMWLDALSPIAAREHWRLIDLEQGGLSGQTLCPTQIRRELVRAGGLDTDVRSVAHLRYPDG